MYAYINHYGTELYVIYQSNNDHPCTRTSCRYMNYVLKIKPFYIYIGKTLEVQYNLMGKIYYVAIFSELVCF